ncbi:uncharacterized protein LOC127831106 [Dreissena polymorpha]|uniref:Protein quiver n=1 Tax=Dreissena polymorpha TaxID=45954 RepID=A0A9D4JSM1_DREPO|nr:uncharacterized protein LOC127831106 [Dreissena polymorpha]KAH3818632.1 hypothetical protein DPMN_120354 [Dreissena polymorpha]
MEYIAILVAVICLFVVTVPASGLTCYVCDSVTYPNSCDVENFDPSKHAQTTTTTVLHPPDTGKTCVYCTKGYYHNPYTGVYSYARGCENSPRGVGCLKDACSCTTDLCNSAVTMSSNAHAFLALVAFGAVTYLMN